MHFLDLNYQFLIRFVASGFVFFKMNKVSVEQFIFLLMFLSVTVYSFKFFLHDLDFFLSFLIPDILFSSQFKLYSFSAALKSFIGHMLIFTHIFEELNIRFCFVFCPLMFGDFKAFIRSSQIRLFFFSFVCVRALWFNVLIPFPRQISLFLIPDLKLVKVY